jgi:hypothetical protein
VAQELGSAVAGEEADGDGVGTDRDGDAAAVPLPVAGAVEDAVGRGVRETDAEAACRAVGEADALTHGLALAVPSVDAEKGNEFCAEGVAAAVGDFMGVMLWKAVAIGEAVAPELALLEAVCAPLGVA